MESGLFLISYLHLFCNWLLQVKIGLTGGFAVWFLEQLSRDSLAGENSENETISSSAKF